MTLKDDFAAKGRVMFAYGADGRVCATQRRISKSAVPLYCALMNLNSPNLPKVISVREDEDGATVTEGYIDGVTLRKALHDGTLGEEELRRLAIDICSALSLLHGSCPPVIHRDIKPENIIRTDGGRYVLIDFDASRLFNPGATSDTVTLGTHGYAAPEQYGFGQTGPESDIYSLGATLYEAAEGKPYAPGAEISCPMGRIIKKCLEFNAKDRYSSADELLKDLGAKKKKPFIPRAAPVILALLLGFCSGLAAGGGIHTKEEAQTHDETPPAGKAVEAVEAVKAAEVAEDIPCTCELITRPNDTRLEGYSLFSYPGAEFLPKSVRGATEFPLTLDIKVSAPVYSKDCKAKTHTAQHWEYSVPPGQAGETITGDKVTVDGPGEYYIYYYCPNFNGTGYGASFSFNVN